MDLSHYRTGSNRPSYNRGGQDGHHQPHDYEAGRSSPNNFDGYNSNYISRDMSSDYAYATNSPRDHSISGGYVYPSSSGNHTSRGYVQDQTLIGTDRNTTHSNFGPLPPMKLLPPLRLQIPDFPPPDSAVSTATTSPRVAFSANNQLLSHVSDDDRPPPPYTAFDTSLPSFASGFGTSELQQVPPRNFESQHNFQPVNPIPSFQHNTESLELAPIQQQYGIVHANDNSLNRMIPPPSTSNTSKGRASSRGKRHGGTKSSSSRHKRPRETNLSSSKQSSSGVSRSHGDHSHHEQQTVSHFQGDIPFQKTQTPSGMTRCRYPYCRGLVYNTLLMACYYHCAAMSDWNNKFCFAELQSGDEPQDFFKNGQCGNLSDEKYCWKHDDRSTYRYHSSDNERGIPSGKWYRRRPEGSKPFPPGYFAPDTSNSNGIPSYLTEIVEF